VDGKEKGEGREENFECIFTNQQRGFPSKKNLYIGEGNVLDLVVLHVESSFVIVMKCIR